MPRLLPGSAVMSLLLAASAAQAEVRIVERGTRYVLDASTLAAVRAQMADRLRIHEQDGLPRSHGLTRSRIEVRRELSPLMPSGCEMRLLEVRLELDVILPSWRPARTPASGLRAQIESMLRGLAEHEAGHRRNSIDAARRIQRGLAALPVAADCEQAGLAVEKLMRRELVRLHLREMRYDERTGNGRTQGAVLRVPERRASALR